MEYYLVFAKIQPAMPKKTAHQQQATLATAAQQQQLMTTLLEAQQRLADIIADRLDACERSLDDGALGLPDGCRRTAVRAKIPTTVVFV